CLVTGNSAQGVVHAAIRIQQRQGLESQDVIAHRRFLLPRAAELLTPFANLLGPSLVLRSTLRSTLFWLRSRLLTARTSWLASRNCGPYAAFAPARSAALLTRLARTNRRRYCCNSARLELA